MSEPVSAPGRQPATSSVVVVMFNSEHTIGDCLRSIPENSEIVLVDQRSSDASVVVALRIRPDAKLVKSGANRGFGAGCNLGAANASGEVLIFLNPDASLDGDCIPLLVDAAINQNALAGPLIIDSAGHAQTRARYWSRVRSDLAEVCFPTKLLTGPFRRDIPADHEVYRSGGRVPYIQGCCMAISSQNFWLADGFDERLFLYREEETLARKLAESDVHAVIVPHATVTHIGASSTSQLRDFSIGQYYRSTAIFYLSNYPRTVANVALLTLWCILQSMALLTPVRRIIGLRSDNGSSWYRAAAAGVVSGWLGRLVVPPRVDQSAIAELPRDGRLRSMVLKSHTGMLFARTAKAAVRRARMEVHDKDFHALEHVNVEDGPALDIGANTGQSAVSILAVRPGFRVLSLEPNPACRPTLSILSLLFGSRMRVMHVGAGEAPDSLTFSVPMRSGRELLEEGTFDVASLSTPASVRRIGHHGSDYSLKEISCPIVRVDDLDQRPVFVKIDVQGLELQVLRGMRSTIRESKPLIMMERNTDEDECTSLLEDFGYRRHYWNGSSMGESPHDSVNVFYLTAEHLSTGRS